MCPQYVPWRSTLYFAAPPACHAGGRSRVLYRSTCAGRRVTQLSGQQPASVDLLEIAVGELVATLPLRIYFIVDPKMPLGVLGDGVLFDEVVLLLRRGLVLAPCVALVDDVLARHDQIPSVAERPLVQFDRHVPRPSGGAVKQFRARQATCWRTAGKCASARSGRRPGRRRPT